MRSSCEASAVNRFSCSNECSSFARVSLNTRARWPISSSGLSTGKRSLRRSAVICSALRVILSIGESARRASVYPPKPARASAIGSPKSRTDNNSLNSRQRGSSLCPSRIRTGRVPNVCNRLAMRSRGPFCSRIERSEYPSFPSPGCGLPSRALAPNRSFRYKTLPSGERISRYRSSGASGSSLAPLGPTLKAPSGRKLSCASTASMSSTT